MAEVRRVDDVEHRAEVGTAATHVSGGAVRAERDIPDRRTDFDGAQHAVAARVSIITKLCGGCAVGRDVQPAAVRAHPHALGGRSGGGRDADRVFFTRLGVEDGDVGAVDSSPAGVEVPPVRADRQVGDAERQRVGRNDLRWTSVSKARIESCSADTLLT